MLHFAVVLNLGPWLQEIQKVFQDLQDIRNNIEHVPVESDRIQRVFVSRMRLLSWQFDYLRNQSMSKYSTDWLPLLSFNIERILTLLGSYPTLPCPSPDRSFDSLQRILDVVMRPFVTVKGAMQVKFPFTCHCRWHCYVCIFPLGAFCYWRVSLTLFFLSFQPSRILSGICFFLKPLN